MRRATYTFAAVFVSLLVLAGFSDEVFAQQSVQIRVADQRGDEIPGSVFDIPSVGISGMATGSPVEFAEGAYAIVIRPAAVGQLVGLSRTALVEVYEDTTEATFEWITSDVTFSIVNQDGTPFDNSALGFGKEEPCDAI